ncbi:MAG TPA: DUF2336 domain-containing protein [Kiloniellales bacterium]
MSASGRELHFLLDLALDRSVEGRRALTHSIGDLFSEGGTTLSDRERALMADILRKLIRDCEMAVRRDLSERLAKAGNPPHDLILALANDEIEVAQPILTDSQVLRDIELIQIIRHRTHQHQLAIAMRRSVSEYVSDALVETGNVDVIKTLLENQDAHISEATMEYLAEESQRVDSYQEPLINRHDLNPELAKRMYLWVSAALRQHILEHFEVHPGQLDDHLEGVAEAISQNPEQHPAPVSATQSATALANKLAKKKQITPDFLIQVLRQGEIALFEAMFGALSGLPAPRLQRVLYDSGGDGLALACRALDIPKSTFATIFLLSRKRSPGQTVVNPRDLARALQLYDRAKPQDAKEVIKMWSRDADFLDAVEQIADEAKPATDT